MGLRRLLARDAREHLTFPMAKFCPMLAKPLPCHEIRSWQASFKRKSNSDDTKDNVQTEVSWINNFPCAFFFQSDPHPPLRELSQISILAECTLILAWRQVERAGVTPC